MEHEYGPQVTPYLQDAWTAIELSAKRERDGQVTGDLDLAAQPSDEPIVLDGWFLPALHALKRWLGWESEPRTSRIPSPSAWQETDPESSTLYREIAPGRFAPVKLERLTVRFAKQLRSRKTIVAVAAIAFVLAGLFPPWLYTLDLADGPHARRDAGFAFIFSPPKQEKARYIGYPPGFIPDGGASMDFPPKLFGIQLDTRRLLVEWACILAVGGAALLLCSRPLAKPHHKST